jgi:phage tail protein X
MTNESRYSQTAQTTRFDGKRILTTTYYPEIPLSDKDIYIIASNADRLDQLAYKYYNNSTYWWVIAQANNLGKGSLFMEEGTQIRIPGDLAGILSAFNTENQ